MSDPLAADQARTEAEAEQLHQAAIARRAAMPAQRPGRPRPKAYARCTGPCGRILPTEELNALEFGRPRGGRLKGRSHRKQQAFCGPCLLAVLRANAPAEGAVPDKAV